MSRTIVVAAAIGVLVIAGAAGALFLGVGPMGGSTESAVTETPESTGTVYEMGSGGGAGTASGGDGGSADGSQDLPPFYFRIKKIEKCGQTCRKVTVTLTNNQNQTANGVTVYTRIYAGNNTKQNNKVWEGKEQVGSMEAGGTYTATKTVKLSYGEALNVKNSDGWITLVTTIESEGTTITFKERRDVT